jgi:tight adherence protein C
MLDQLILPVLAFVAAIAVGGAIIAAQTPRRQRLQSRVRDINPEPAGAGDTRREELLRTLTRVGTAATGGRSSQNLKAELASAGYHTAAAPVIFMGAKLLLLSAGILVLSVLLLPLAKPAFSVRLAAILCGGALLFLTPNLVVWRRRAQRRQEVRIHLPDALDLLEVCVSAGMGLDLAWNSVAEEIRGVCPTLADEMALTDFEIHLNAPRAAAMRHMAERTQAEELSSLVAVLVQSERFGTSIGEALRTFSESMRDGRSQQAEETAEKMVVKLLFPMITLIFPAIFIVICGPAALRWAEVLSGR